MGEVIKKTKGGRFVGWYLRFVDADGKRKQRASGQPTFGEAKRMLAEIEARIARGKLGVPERDEVPTLTIAELAERYLAEYDSPKIRDRDGWAVRRRSNLTPFLKMSGQLLAASLTPVQAERVRNVLIRKHKPNTTSTILAAAHSMFEWSTEQKLVETNPFAKVRRPAREANVEYLTKDDARRLIEAAEGRADLRGGVFAIGFRLGLFAGLRAGEIFGLRWSDVDFGRGTLTVRRSFHGPTKSGKPRTVPMPDELAQALLAWKQRCPATPEGVVCPLSQSRSARANAQWCATNHPPSPIRYYKAASIAVPAAPWHCLRHTYASTFVQSSGSILTLQKLLGHGDIKTTMVYAHLDDAFVMAEVKKRLSY
jgi:integrase